MNAETTTLEQPKPSPRPHSVPETWGIDRITVEFSFGTVGSGFAGCRRSTRLNRAVYPDGGITPDRTAPFREIALRGTARMSGIMDQGILARGVLALWTVQSVSRGSSDPIFGVRRIARQLGQ